MKSIVLNLIIGVTLFFVLPAKVDAQINEKFIGNWNFECLLAPAGFNEGLIVIQTDSVFAKCGDGSNRFPAILVKMANDTLLFNVDINGILVQCMLLAVDDKRLAGRAGTMEDESRLILTKKEEEAVIKTASFSPLKYE